METAVEVVPFEAVMTLEPGVATGVAAAEPARVTTAGPAGVTTAGPAGVTTAGPAGVTTAKPARVTTAGRLTRCIHCKYDCECGARDHGELLQMLKLAHAASSPFNL